jgi:6-phosphogluconolactonase/glucosamine-6-phosphate isomerase/deaminase
LRSLKEVLVLATGADKAATAQQVLEGPSDPQRFPIQLIDPPQGQMTWLLDAPAAGM